MASKLYTVVQIDSPRDFPSLELATTGFELGAESRGFEFRRLLHDYPPCRPSNLFFIDNEYNDRLREHYFHIVDDLKNHSSCGLFIFKDVHTLGYDSLIVDELRARVYIGNMLNWGRDYFDWWIENSGVGFERWVDKHSFMADFGVATPGHEHGILMNAPGYGIYGHWLIDFVPRLELSKLIAQEASIKYLFGPLKDWMKDLIAKSGIREFESLGTCFEKHDKLIVPTSTKFGYGFFEPINTHAWRSLALRYNHENVDSTFPSTERIFVSRRHWQSERAIDYYEELEALVADLGFVVVYPETLSLAEQALLFSKARIVVGEDGSALHNVIFSAPGTRLGVLMHAERSNLWHAGICDLLGHQIAYAQLPNTPELSPSDLDAISSFVERLAALNPR